LRAKQNIKTTQGNFTTIQT